PIRAADGAERGVIAEGAVGSRLVGWLPLFRYELRFWRDGVIPDIAEAVESPRHLTDAPVWGRDELHAGEMWNSNSVISWLLMRSGLGTDGIRPPRGGRAPGWDAGLAGGGGA